MEFSEERRGNPQTKERSGLKRYGEISIPGRDFRIKNLASISEWLSIAVDVDPGGGLEEFLVVVNSKKGS